MEEDPYQTRIYALDGQMLEYFCSASDPFKPELGEELADVEQLSFTMETPNLLKVSVVMAGGEAEQLHIALRSREVQP